ncbi:Stf0 family sulfotransferase [Sphingomonas sp. HMP6]|uniref:Stf0 family sulfotransferase n=1 Tax=Sphingomonas sp. HMP6 TaxID=1517551 RepID=UPI0015970CD4|nr:Stf0 family sulfotransferase [Sphingomonas sp. HMP6]BCA57658.1 hypothetical protein HMP06_0427 [Sphingomonas sp. HMP6]
MSRWSMETRKRYDLTLAAHDYPAWDGRPKRTILLCSEQRSGSTLLGEALYFAGGLGCPLEYFHIGFRPDFVARWATDSADAYLNAVHRHRTGPNGTFSAKLFWRDVLDLLAERDLPLRDHLARSQPNDTPPDLYQRAAATLGPLFDGATFLHLKRLDRVRGAVSGDLAEQTGLWRAIPGVGEHEPLTDPEFDFDRIAARIANTAWAHAHWANLFAAIGATPISLSYESLKRDYAGSVGSVLRALGSDVAPTAPRMNRQSDRRSEDFALRYLHEAQARVIASKGSV